MLPVHSAFLRRSFVFLPLHILVGFLWFWLSSPKKIPGYRSHDRDFRGQRRDRHDYLAHFQAALATLLFPPTNKAWPENFLLWRDRFRAVATKQFVVVTVFQFLETEALLWIWVFLANANVPVLPTLLAVTGWTVLRIICHVGYYVFLLFPLYTCEWEQCMRRRGKRDSEHFRQFFVSAVTSLLPLLIKQEVQGHPERRQTGFSWSSSGVAHDFDAVGWKRAPLEQTILPSLFCLPSPKQWAFNNLLTCSPAPLGKGCCFVCQTPLVDRSNLHVTYYRF